MHGEVQSTPSFGQLDYDIRIIESLKIYLFLGVLLDRVAWRVRRLRSQVYNVGGEEEACLAS